MSAKDVKFGAEAITKAGVTVAQDIELEGKFENMGAQMVKEVASKTSEIAGDGTTMFNYNKILFIIPPQIVNNHTGVDQTPTLSIPLGVLYIASFIIKEKLECDLKVYDARLGGDLYEDGNNSKMFGDSWEEVENQIKDFDPDIVGISNMFSVQINAAFKISRICKKLNKKIVTIIGGPHASSFPVETLKEKSIDFVVMGEGEERFLELVRQLRAGKRPEIQGVLKSEDDMELLRPNKKAPITFIRNLDEVPIPAYHLVDFERYFFLQSKGFAPRLADPGKRSVSMITSRGCPHQCIFCSVQTTMGYRWRQHSPKYIEKHISYLVEQLKIDYIHFEDDNFTHDIERYDKILDVLIAQKKLIKWGTPNAVRADSWSHKLIEKTKNSGAQYLSIAIESSSQRVIDEVIKKKLDLQKVEPVMKACYELDLPLFSSYVLGLPGETKEELNGTVNWALDKYEKYGVNPGFNLAIPLPGTEFYDITLKENLFHGVNLHDAPKRNSIKTNEFDTDFLSKLFIEAQKRRHRITIKRMFRSPKVFRYYFRQMIKYIPRSLQIAKEIIW